MPKTIENHPEGKTQTERAWFNYFHILLKITGVIDSGETLDKKNKKKLFHTAQIASNIRDKYDPVPEPKKPVFTRVE